MRKISAVLPYREFKKVLLVLLALTVSLLGGCAEKYREQGNALSREIYKVLFQYGYCTDYSDCNKKEVMFGEDGDRVYLSFYAIDDQKLLASIVSVVVMEGLKITGGVPITISVFPRAKRDYVNSFESFSQRPVIRMEVNQE